MMAGPAGCWAALTMDDRDELTLVVGRDWVRAYLGDPDDTVAGGWFRWTLQEDAVLDAPAFHEFVLREWDRLARLYIFRSGALLVELDPDARPGGTGHP